MLKDIRYQFMDMKVPPFSLRLNHMNPLLLAKFETEILEFELLNLTAACHGEFLDEEDVAGDFVAGNLTCAEVAHVKVVHLHAFVKNDEGAHFFAVAL